ncbi:PD-(D/E)XK nuclease domain-containing protein [Chryseobacterium bernardetii]|uniref:PD-(D/E)XK nuclease domain-containing protein n=1 Tax=Chryseobacterium bernardetii TaxID=1241978 RepID=UPI000F4D9089|nr:hypothetical protein [Chryseobacterium bernardetii]AZB34251.1 hypothetical protein EG351_11885 [Chryseobacterium bernardetii]
MDNWIPDIIKKNTDRVFEYPTVQEFCFYKLYNKAKLENLQVDKLSGEEEILAAKGYKSLTPTPEELSIVNKPENNRIAHYKYDKYKLIGICLAHGKNGLPYEYLQNFVLTASVLELFLIQKFFPEFKDAFNIKLSSIKDNNLSVKLLKYIFLNNSDENIDNIITGLSSNDLETEEILTLMELQSFYSKMAVQQVIYKDLTAKDLIIAILKNFENSIKKISDKAMRYGKEKQNRAVISINDEYDVQDLLYIPLKSIFPEIKYEDDIGNYGGSAKRLDFYLREEGIIIEVKHINIADDKKYTKQMKEDLQSYHVVNKLNDIIFFIYAPNAIQDINNFNELQNIQTIHDKTFNVIVIVVE